MVSALLLTHLLRLTPADADFLLTHTGCLSCCGAETAT
jgi:hypothetical protein